MAPARRQLLALPTKVPTQFRSVGTSSSLLSFNSNRQLSRSARPTSTMDSENLITDLQDFLRNDASFRSDFNTMLSVWVEMGLDQATIRRKWRTKALEMKALLDNKMNQDSETAQREVLVYRLKNIRSEIVEWWDKCCYSEQQRSEFTAFYDETCTNELLEKHRTELENLQQYHKTHLHLFEAIENYLGLREKYLYLEAEAKNPNRLFENRGGQLLKNERDLKLARKDLPRLEKELATLTGDFEHVYGREFTINGETLEQLLASNKEKLKKDIEEINMQNNAELKTRVTHGSALKRKVPTVVSSTSKSTSKIGVINKRSKPLI